MFQCFGELQSIRFFPESWWRNADCNAPLDEQKKFPNLVACFVQPRTFAINRSVSFRPAEAHFHSTLQ